MHTHLQVAHDVAELLNSSRSPFSTNIRIKPKGSATLLRADLCSRVKADLGTSLVGLARVGWSFPRPKSAKWMANIVATVCKTLDDHSPTLLAEKKLLTPPPDATKGSALMLIGVAVALSFRVMASGKDEPTPADLGRLVVAAKHQLDLDASRCRTAPARRNLLGEFVRHYFADMRDIQKVGGVPVGLLMILSTSAFGPPGGTAVATTSLPRPPLKARREQAITLLNDPEVAGWSDKEIARRCGGMSGNTIKKLREELGLPVPQVRKAARGGKSYLIDVSGAIPPQK